MQPLLSWWASLVAAPPSHPGVNASALETSFPALPAELVLRILFYTLAPASHSTHAERTRQLCVYAGFSRDCARWACLELRRDVRLRSFEQARWFARSVLRQRGRTWARGVHVLRIGSDPDREDQGDVVWRSPGAGALVKDLLRLCEHAEELWISGLSGLHPSDLAPGQQLRRIWLNEMRIVPSTDNDAPCCLPRLTTLYLKAIISTGHALPQLLSTSVLPALQHLEYHSVHQSLVTVPAPPPAPPLDPLAVPDDNGGAANLTMLTAHLAALRADPNSSSESSAGFEHPLCALADQLRTLTLGIHAPRSLPPAALSAVLARAQALKGLSLPIPMLLGGRLPFDSLRLCRTLRAIRLTGTPETRDSRRAGATAVRTGGWRDAAFDLVTQALPGPLGRPPSTASARPDARAESEDGPDPSPPQRTVQQTRELVQVEAAVQTGVRILEQADRGGGIVTAPAVDAGDAWTFRRGVGWQGPARVDEEREGVEEEVDGPWLIGAARWRMRRGLE